MGSPMLGDAFAHHVWATMRLIDACASLTPEQLGSSVPGTYGTILDTLRHVVGSDSWYLYSLTGGRAPTIDEDHMDLAELRAAMAVDGEWWTSVLAADRDPDEVVIRRREDGSETHAPVSIRLAQALHHGTDHRSQVCTALTNLGIEPPAIDVWDYASEHDRSVEIPPTA
jgi:uncharacterized damage-inducible protein DinB